MLASHFFFYVKEPLDLHHPTSQTTTFYTTSLNHKVDWRGVSTWVSCADTLLKGCTMQGDKHIYAFCTIWWLEQRTFPSPVSLGSKSNVSTIFSVKLCHQSFVGVTDHKDAGVKSFNLLPAALMCLNADTPPTPPVVPLPFKPCETVTVQTKYIWSWMNMPDKCWCPPLL